MTDKLTTLRKWSNPEAVQRMSDELLDGADIFVSTNRLKKYMVQDPDGKWIHFGQMGYEDYTKHNDEQRRDAFRKRNHKWAKSPKWSAAWLAYHLLW